ncbi:MAG: radical SAM protein [Planctomycetes bacterium]|nr:radical SAM protein [Planctomycetota bacterium]
MSFEVLARLVAAALREPSHEAVDFMWHGGEPTLLPIRFYEKALYLEARFRRPGQLVANRMQTNGTRVTGEWVRFWRANDFSIGLSLDGPPELHDLSRPDAGGRGTSGLVTDALHRLEDGGVPFTVLVVLDEPALILGAERFLAWLVERRIRRVALLAAHPKPGARADPGVRPAGYPERRRVTEFLAALYDRWLEHGDAGIWIRELASLRSRIEGERPAVCTMAGGCLGSFFQIEPGGAISHCGYFAGDTDHALGHIATSNFGEIAHGEALGRLREAEALRLDRLRGCPEFSVCRGYCPHERYLAGRFDPGTTEGCCGLAPLIRHVRERKAAMGNACPENGAGWAG